ncbi:NAD kinase [Candidatus Azobacteroides pseudotrichonymphae]|uniref:NAD kinase n=1 Tax=Azobacteroides pseudotrichonymphae genomovar. CFP2 TaxID=511995 RepID=B6YQL4_AZOPC|nr:NAD kinase [Candidatus Azobacteroides pseudotrichonymphae]BAG83486.1 NAD+ kinase [Candidatus Azobacteroides pseudotrichonymphae genomovar. CFP2]
MKIGIFGGDYQTSKQSFIKSLFDYLSELGAKIWIDEFFYNYLSKYFAFTPKIEGFVHREMFLFDMVFSLGGDGTFLRTVAWVGHRNIPILGINTGHLGFLADINTSEITETIDEIFQGKYRIEERSLLQIETSPQFREQYNCALNEIAILKRDTSSMISICTYLNDIFLTEYLADGLLLATPSGSTAYNLSVNGPIIIPQAHNFVLSPVAPHSLNVRPLVIPEDYEIRFIVESRSKNFLVSLDGRSEIFPSGSEFQAKKSDFTIKVVKRFNQNFYNTLRKKLLWGEDIRKKI